MTTLLLSLVSFVALGLPAIAIFFLWLVKSGRARFHKFDGNSATISFRDGRIHFCWWKPRFQIVEAELMNSEHDLQLTLGLCLATVWITFGSQTLFSKETREKFWNRWGSYESREIGISYHDAALFIKIWQPEDEYSSKHPAWWRFFVRMPWDTFWLYTEILKPDLSRAVWRECHDDGKALRNKMNELRETCAKSVSSSHPYEYRLKNGETQIRTATIHVERRAWGYRWLRLPLKKRTTIDVRFSDEVGEGAGSWKGGCLGCGYDMKPGETPLDTLRRMERDRKFTR